MAKEEVKYIVYREIVDDNGTDRHFQLFDAMEDATKALDNNFLQDDKKFKSAMDYYETYSSKKHDEYQFWVDGRWSDYHCVGKIIKIVPNISDSASYSEVF